jgi:hypothetical protein
MNMLFAIDAQNLTKSLDLFWKGMLAIFLVMGIIYLVIIILNKATATPKEKIVAPFKKIYAKIKGSKGKKKLRNNGKRSAFSRSGGGLRNRNNGIAERSRKGKTRAREN